MRHFTVPNKVNRVTSVNRHVHLSWQEAPRLSVSRTAQAVIQVVANFAFDVVQARVADAVCLRSLAVRQKAAVLLARNYRQCIDREWKS
jgi:hypothetical protein